jgi:prepilin-type N-terminal cleavage/methylation domain-containing protein
MSSMQISGGYLKQKGLSFVELAVVLLIVAILSLSVSSAFIATNESLSRREAFDHATQVQAGIRAYALRNGRLPCPALDGRGYENRIGQDCAVGIQLGYVPYVALGLQAPTQALLARYAVYRDSNTNALLDADLTLARERNGDSAGDPHYADSSDLMAALLRIDASTPTSLNPYLTGDDDSVGAANCSTVRITFVAYWLVLPMTDANKDSDRLDGPNTPNGLCASYPFAKATAQFDDVVIAETPLQLAGWLRSAMQP